MSIKPKLILPFVLFYSLICGAQVIAIENGPDIQEKLQEALILAKPGDTIRLGEGFYSFSDGLSLDVDEVKVVGAGMDKTVLSFAEQQSGAQGLLVTSSKVILKDFAIEDAKGDALKVIGADGIYMVNIRTEWTGGPKSTNGAYGLYPVESKDVLIDGCVAIGASDAGIYVGQSENIIVRNSRAHYNVAGIEIENSYYADVYDNVASHNTGGILVFDLPDLPQQGGHHVRVFRNKAVDNDTDNFAPEGNIVGTVPAGSGLMVLANDNIEVFDNTFADNNSANVLILSYYITERAFEDENYDPFPESINVHNNKFDGGGTEPDSEPLIALQAITGQPIPDIVWDGAMIPNQQANKVLCMRRNGEIGFVNLDAGNGFVNPNFDSEVHNCEFPSLSEISLSLGIE